MSVVLSDVHTCLQHQNGEWYARDPADKAEDCEDGEDCKDDTSAPQVFVEIVDSGSHRKSDVKYASQPDELLRECASSHEVSPGEDQRNTEHEYEEDESIGVEREIVAGVVNTTAAEALVLRITLDCNTRDRGVTEKYKYQLEHSQYVCHCVLLGRSYQNSCPQIIPLRLDFECLLETLLVVLWSHKPFVVSGRSLRVFLFLGTIVISHAILLLRMLVLLRLLVLLILCLW